MLHDDVRVARVQHGLSQSELARRAGIPRSRLVTFEQGGNITIETLQKIVSQLPNLQTLHLGAVQLRTGGPDPAAMREPLEALVESAQQVLKALEGSVGARQEEQPRSRKKLPPLKRKPGRRVDERES